MTYFAYPGIRHSKQELFRQAAVKCSHAKAIEKLENLKEAIRVILGLEWNKVISKSRKQNLVRIRDVISILMYEPFAVTAKQVGEWLGGRDHSTILKNIRTARHMLKNDDEFKELHKTLLAYL